MSYDLSTKKGLANSVKWLENHLAMIRSGGMWGIPRSGTLYRIDHEAKTATKLIAHAPDPSLDTVFKAAGWAVKSTTPV